jgi:hypothetical protein
MLLNPCHGVISHHPAAPISRAWAGAGPRVPADAVISTANSKD